ncbi:MAG: sigma-70 family RNA polymerase sigma factor, partial [Cyclobacteriaceae bacterium]|nr:sigma-70 family RNA polymerase sigma factor [Cyclobacteriaceae bacterium]
SYKTSASEDAHEWVVHKDLSEDIGIIIETLPEQCRNIFKMSRFRGMKNKEIAEIYAISPRTVETQIYRALKVLKEKLNPYLSISAILIQIIIKGF